MRELQPPRSTQRSAAASGGFTQTATLCPRVQLMGSAAIDTHAGLRTCRPSTSVRPPSSAWRGSLLLWPASRWAGRGRGGDCLLEPSLDLSPLKTLYPTPSGPA